MASLRRRVVSQNVGGNFSATAQQKTLALVNLHHRRGNLMPTALLGVPRGDAVACLRHVHEPASYQYRVARTPLGGVSKRAFDVVCAATALTLLSPILLVVALMVRIDSPGPALFRQQRTGFRGRAFHILKFRTMRTMEGGRDVTQAKPGDTRVTRFGRLLRRTSIDELPQLINVLYGDMSLVGPRPHAVRHDRDFFLVDRHYTCRFLARPGITGAAQVGGARGVTDTREKIERRLELDLDYVENWSIGRDIHIVLRTVRVLLGDGQAC
jgi:putative colanic acid biosysnthesis UDP-glucose lipid carrier transferase